jgi:polyisoprenoid-binding protein YceI
MNSLESQDVRQIAREAYYGFTEVQNGTWKNPPMEPVRRTLRRMRYGVLCLLVSAVLSSVSRAQVPAFVITPDESTIKFYVKASVALTGTFDKWDATLTFTSPDVATGVLDIKIQADSVNTGSGMKDGKLKSKDFFDVTENPSITFLSKKIVQTGPDTFEVQGDFAIRGVTKPETLTLTVSGVGTGSGEIKGTMAFDRKDYGMNKGIPFIKIADRVEVTVNLKAKRVSGPPLVLKQ